MTTELPEIPELQPVTRRVQKFSEETMRELHLVTANMNVIAVNIRTGARRVMKTGLTAQNAEAFIKFAVLRSGVETEYYVAETEDATRQR